MNEPYVATALRVAAGIGPLADRAAEKGLP
jgi:hypothetical protein